MEKVETVRDFLVAARNVITEPENWTQDAWARDAYGVSVDVNSPDAVCWCASSAFVKVADSHDRCCKVTLNQALALFDDVVERLSGMSSVLGSSVVYNDTHSHSEVLRAFDKAVESC